MLQFANLAGGRALHKQTSVSNTPATYHHIEFCSSFYASGYVRFTTYDQNYFQNMEKHLKLQTERARRKCQWHSYYQAIDRRRLITVVPPLSDKIIHWEIRRQTVQTLKRWNGKLFIDPFLCKQSEK